MNENNVKIRIEEYDNTSPVSGGTDSTDIAFIPGFSSKSNAPQNVPTLCTSVKQFEEKFGTEPVKLTEGDILDYADYGFVVEECDRGYIFAKELLAQGMSIVYVNLYDDKAGADSSKLAMFYGDNSFFATTQLDTTKDGNISDKSLYSVKYITSGGYPAVVKDTDESAKDVFAQKMIDVAAARGDAIALIDYQLDQETSCDDFYGMLSDCLEGKDISGYGAAMYPWGEYTCASAGGKISMPASFGYLMCVAKAIKTSPNWLAMAGVSRGVVPNLQKLLVPNNRVSNTAAEHMQPKFGAEDNKLSVNCITDVRPYGLTLWGNRTLKELEIDKGCTALNFLNTRNMISDIKKLLYTTAKSLMFEQNSDTLWLKFKSSVSPLFEQLKSGNGISDYKLIKGETRYDGSPLTKGELAAIIRITPIHALEYFELSVEIRDDDVNVI